jgi:hypothetical protein
MPRKLEADVLMLSRSEMFWPRLCKVRTMAVSIAARTSCGWLSIKSEKALSMVTVYSNVSSLRGQPALNVIDQLHQFCVRNLLSEAGCNRCVQFVGTYDEVRTLFE